MKGNRLAENILVGELPEEDLLGRMSKRVQRSSYQGLRHLMPQNISPLRALITRGQVRNQLDSLKELNRLSPLQPPLLHRPDSRYVKTVLVKS